MTDTLNTGSAGSLPSDAVQIGSVPIYYSNTSPGYVWVTCFGSLLRLKVSEDYESELVKAEAVRFWSSDGPGRYEPQSESSIDLGTVTEEQLRTLDRDFMLDGLYTDHPSVVVFRRITRFSEPLPDQHAHRLGLKVSGVEA